MAEITLVIDPDGSSFALHDRANGRWMTGFSAPTPETKSQWASSIDTEGDRRAVLGYQNRVITANVFLQKSTAALLESLENDLGKKIGKLQREGGVLRMTTPAGTTVNFDVEEASHQRVWDPGHVVTNLAQYEVTFVCQPFGYGTEVELGSDTTETSLPYLVKTVTGPVGDVPARGRLLVDNDEAVDQWWLAWGLESKNYSSSANAALFYQAESRTTMGGAAATAVATASGGTVVRQGTLSTDYLAMLSTQASGGGAHLSHVGEFNAYARVMAGTANAGTVTVALEWAETDFLRYTRNPETTIPVEHEGRWRYVDLGPVSPNAVTAGTQRWEGRVVAKSTSNGDRLDLDYLIFMPVAEGSGIASGVNRPFTPTSYSAEDRFTSTSAGTALNGRVAPTGGTWATSGDATDFAFSDDLTSETAKRSAVSGTSGRFGILGSTNYAGVIVSSAISMDGGATSGFPQAGVIARWTDSSNHLRAVIYRDSSGSAPFETYLEIHEVLAGTKTVVAQEITTSISGGGFSGSTFKVELTVTTAGLATATVTATGGGGADGAVTGDTLPAGTVVMTTSASIASAASGATLATGKPGLFDLETASTAGLDRYYDDFLVATIPADAAAFASQSIEIRHDRIVREDSGGTLWSKLSSYVGDYLLIPPTGAEGRSARVIVKMARNDPFELDNGIDDASMRLFATPRFLAIPD